MLIPLYGTLPHALLHPRQLIIIYALDLLGHGVLLVHLDGIILLNSLKTLLHLTIKLHRCGARAPYFIALVLQAVVEHAQLLVHLVQLDPVARALQLRFQALAFGVELLEDRLQSLDRLHVRGEGRDQVVF